MKELELEAEKYAQNTFKECFDVNIYCDEGSLSMGFIAGATSKYVEKQKLEFAKIELEKFRSRLSGYGIPSVILKKELEVQIYELTKQLKEL